MKHGKKYSESAKLIETGKLYDTNEAVDLVVKTATAKFDETVEIHVRWVLTHATLTNRFAVLLYFPTVQVKL